MAYRSITVRCDRDYEHDIHLTDFDTGEPIDVTDWTFDSQLRPSPSSDIIAATITVTVIDAEAGHIQLSLDRDTTAPLWSLLVATLAGIPPTDTEAAVGQWDCRVTIGGKTSNLFEGPAYVFLTVTHDA